MTRPILLALALSACATIDEPEGRIDGPPLYIHLCDAMPDADAEAWGRAAGEINAGYPLPPLWVGHGEPIGCDTVDVCPSWPARATRIGACVITVRYAPGIASEAAAQELRGILDAL